MYNIALFHQQLLCFRAYCFNERLGKKGLFVKLGYALVEIDTGCKGK